jgi:hypothetical protein
MMRFCGFAALAVVIWVSTDLPAAGQAASAKLAISPPAQSIEDFGREWRRARKMARACGADKAYMEFLGFSEGFLVRQKYDEQKALGKTVLEDGAKYSLGFQDDFDATPTACQQHLKALEPILQTLHSDMEARAKSPIYAAPKVACPRDRPC